MSRTQTYAYDINLTPSSGTATAAFQRWKDRASAPTYTSGSSTRQLGVITEFRLETQNGSTVLAATWYTDYFMRPATDVTYTGPTLTLDDELIDLTVSQRGQTTLLPLFF
jgi:hypothetical protein